MNNYDVAVPYLHGYTLINFRFWIKKFQISSNFKISTINNYNRAITDFKLDAIASKLYFSTHLCLALFPRSFAASKS